MPRKPLDPNIPIICKCGEMITAPHLRKSRKCVDCYREYMREYQRARRGIANDLNNLEVCANSIAAISPERQMKRAEIAALMRKHNLEEALKKPPKIITVDLRDVWRKFDK